MKARLSSLYTLLPLTRCRRRAPFDRCHCAMAWITEGNHSKAASFHSLIEFLWESSLRPDAQEAFLAGGGVGGWGGGGTYFLMSTVVTVNLTPFSHRTMKSLWQKGQLPTFSPSCPAWKSQRVVNTFLTRSVLEDEATAIYSSLFWQTSHFGRKRRVLVRDYNLRHLPQPVEKQPVTDAAVGFVIFCSSFEKNSQNFNSLFL